MRVYVIYDSGDPNANVEQMRAFTLEARAARVCRELNSRDYPELTDQQMDLVGSDDEEDVDCWRWTFLDVEEGA